MAQPMLHLICGKAGAGKSTLAARLRQEPGTIVLSEDQWLSTLYADQMATLGDYVRCASRLRSVIGPHVAALLQAGLSVVLDFPANTRETRDWMRGILDQSGADHRLHLLDLPDAVCKQRLRARDATGTHPFTISDAQFDQLARHFAPPTADERFTIIRYGD